MQLWWNVFVCFSVEMHHCRISNTRPLPEQNHVETEVEVGSAQLQLVTGLDEFDYHSFLDLKNQ